MMSKAVCAVSRVFVLLIFLSPCPSVAQTPDGLSCADLERIGRRIWQNECAGRVEGLTSWNAGENFASLGIGHFIWYPAGVDGPFEESFPALISWMRRRGVEVPGWLLETADCPWPNRAAFLKDRDSVKQQELRVFLSRTVAEQTEFIMARLDGSLARLTSAAGAAADRVATNVHLLRQTPEGTFALVDYVNFKGEGLSPTERYKGQGWGLLQVLTDMKARDAADAPRAFADSAKRVLTRRVENSPPERDERRWLAGWLNRCESYVR
jgi:hypothetical protein